MTVAIGSSDLDGPIVVAVGVLDVHPRTATVERIEVELTTLATLDLEVFPGAGNPFP